MPKSDPYDPPPPYTPLVGDTQPHGPAYSAPDQYQSEDHGPTGVGQPPGYQPYSGPAPYPGGPGGNGPCYGAIRTVTVPQTIIIVNACPACRIGVLEDQYNALGILCAILFFPIGVLCCLATKTKKCSNCGAYFD
ncbi:membrane protein BRI3 [Hetaerina americana]|uniref:membrane protein BRI3 n=1 Tax=Hetaerina americana TaxID=62018 RepID=UPI003A7F5F5E